MNARTLKTTLIAASLALTIPLAAQARPPMGDGWGNCDRPMMMKKHGGPGMAGGPGLRGIDLSEAQRDQIFNLRHALAPAMREQAKVAREAQQQLADLARADNFDANRARALAETKARAHAEMVRLRAENQHAVLQVLTPEQRQQWLERGRAGRPGGDDAGWRPRRG